MLRLLFTALACLISVSMFGQISILDEKNGFREIKFGTDVDSYLFIKECKERQDKYFSFEREFMGNKIWDQEFTWSIPTHYVDIMESGYNKLSGYDIKKILIEADDKIIRQITLVIDHPSAGLYLYLYDVFGHAPTYTYESCFGDCVRASWWGEVASMSLVSFHLDNDTEKRKIGYILSFSNNELSSIKSQGERKTQEKERQNRIDSQF